MSGQQTGVCRHCLTPIVRTGDGWIHTSRRTECVDQWGYTLPTVAEPRPRR